MSKTITYFFKNMIPLFSTCRFYFLKPRYFKGVCLIEGLHSSLFCALNGAFVKVSLFQRCFSCFLNCANDIKSCKASYMIKPVNDLVSMWLSLQMTGFYVKRNVGRKRFKSDLFINLRPIQIMLLKVLLQVACWFSLHLLDWKILKLLNKIGDMWTSFIDKCSQHGLNVSTIHTFHLIFLYRWLARISWLSKIYIKSESCIITVLFENRTDLS